MLTGDIGVTKGDAFINQHSVVDDILAARQSMGYCPQFDALNDLLTAREHLKLYARIRGIEEEDVNQVCTIKKSPLVLSKDEQSQVKAFSFRGKHLCDQVNLISLDIKNAKMRRIVQNNQSHLL